MSMADLANGLLVQNFKAGQMLLSPCWQNEVDFRKTVATVEPWLVEAVANRAVNLSHPFLSRNRSKVCSNNPIYFNGVRYNSWEDLRSAPIENYGPGESSL